MISSNTSLMFLLPAMTDLELPGLHHEAECLGGHDVHSFVADDQQDSGEVAEDDRLGVRAHLLLVLFLQLVKIDQGGHQRVVLLGIGVDVLQLRERLIDRTVKCRGLRCDAQGLHVTLPFVGVSL